MKTRVLYLFAALIIFASCTNEEVTTVIPVSDEFYCSIENEESTRTSLDQNSNVTWSAEDQLVIFKKSSIPSRYQISESHVGKTSGSFYKVNSDEFNAGSELDHNVALYPYQENVEITKLDSDSPTSSYKITGYNFPAEQTYAENSFANGAFPMTAVSDNYDLTFRNVCGGIKLQLKGTQKVTSIKIEGKNSEKLAGNADVIVYSDENLKPAITMASNALTSVILNCGSGVSLNESTATEFIIALPPVLFNKGFIVEVVDSEGKTHKIETDKANTILRSSILSMPSFKIGSSEYEDGNDDNIVPVQTIKLTYSVIRMNKGDNLGSLFSKLFPTDATDKNLIWSSDAPAIVSIDQTGLLTAVSVGTAKISVTAGGAVATCTVLVTDLDYIDEYDVNHGHGVAIGKAIWAPVNCGYHCTNHPYGKLYQWGRKYGQSCDESVAIMEGGVSLYTGQNQENANIYYSGVPEYYNDWIYPQNHKLWNNGDDYNPKKTEYDPCPNGWRVPTYNELWDLIKNSSREDDGVWFSGSFSYSENVGRVFLTNHDYPNIDGRTRYSAAYWSSKPYFQEAYLISLNGYDYMMELPRKYDCSVRCVQE